MGHRVATRLVPQIRQHWRLFLFTTIAATIAQIVGIPLAMLTRKMVNIVAKEGRTQADIAHAEQTLLILGSMLVGLTLLRGISRWFKGVLGERFAQRVIADIRKEMLSHIHDLSMGYFDRRAAGKIVIRFVGDAQGLRGWLANKLSSIPADILTVIGVVIAVGSIHIQLLYALIIPPVALLPILLLINPKARQWTRAARSEQSRLTGDLTNRVAMIQAIKASGAKQASLEPLYQRVDTAAGAFVKRSVLDATGQALALTVGSLSLCAIGIWGAMLILHDQATSGDIVGAVWLSVLIRSPINRLTSTNIAYHRVKVAFDRIDALLTRKPESGLGSDLLPYTGSDMRIRLKELGYHDRSGRWVVRNLTRTIQGPGCVAIRGDANATNAFFELLLRLRRPHEGRVGLDGVNARKLRLDDIRSHIGWVDARRHMIPATLVAHDLNLIESQLESTSQIATEKPTRQELESLAAFESQNWVTGAMGLGLAVACALVNDPPILLIDQPEMGLTQREIKRFGQWLEEESKSRLILVASNKGWIKPLSTKMIRLRSEESQ